MSKSKRIAAPTARKVLVEIKHNPHAKLALKALDCGEVDEALCQTLCIVASWFEGHEKGMEQVITGKRRSADATRAWADKTRVPIAKRLQSLLNQNLAATGKPQVTKAVEEVADELAGGDVRKVWKIKRMFNVKPQTGTVNLHVDT